MKPYHKNPRQITGKQYEQLTGTLAELGDLSGIVHDLNSDEIIGGNQRSRVFDVNKCDVVLTEQYDEPDAQGTVAHGYVIWNGAKYAYRQVRWTAKQCEKANIVANKAGGSWDFDTLANEFEVDELLDWGFEPYDLGMEDWENSGDGDGSNEDESEDEILDLYSRWDVPDALWPSDNDFGVPLLDLNMQAMAFDQPWAVWGSVSRKARMSGTWLFYTQDYRYEQLWRDPSGILNTQCLACVEPNFSAYSNMPPAVALWQIYRKRWIARWWQSYGIQIWVDLNVAIEHADLNLLGIPNGWRSFATRGYTDRIDATHAEYETAQRIAGENVTPLFLVYGGGKAVKEECQRMGWIWLQENMDTGKGLEV